jgi:hypothetical protein
MDKFTLDCSQMERWDFVRQPPVPIVNVPPKRPLMGNDLAALQSALRWGKALGIPAARLAGEVVDIASKPVAATLISPTKLLAAAVSVLPVIKFSTKTQITESIGLTSTVAMAIGIVGSAGVYASSAREVGAFLTGGGGVFVNTTFASTGVEFAHIFGPPSDFAGPYFGISVSVGEVLSAGATLLFAPTLPLSVPPVLTLMGVAINFSGGTPTLLPVTVSVQVTDTFITGVKF